MSGSAATIASSHAFERATAEEDWIRTPSKSGKPGRYHIIVTLTNPVTDRDRLFYQLALGSDRKRGLLWIARVNAGDPVPTLFFEKNS